MVTLAPARRQRCEAIVLHPRAFAPQSAAKKPVATVTSEVSHWITGVPLVEPVLAGLTKVGQALHYHAYRYTVAGMYANVEMTIGARIEAKGCDFDNLFSGRAKGSRRSTAHIAFGRPQIRAMLRRCVPQRLHDPVTLRCLRLFCEDILGPQASLEAAIKRAKKLLLLVHPDKTRHIPDLHPLEAEARNEAYSLITHLRPVLEDPFYGPALYRDGRLDYGKIDWGKLRPTALAASLTAMAVGFFLPFEPRGQRCEQPCTYWLRCSDLSL